MRAPYALTVGFLAVLACGGPIPTDYEGAPSFAKSPPSTALTVSSTSPSESPRDTTLDILVRGTGFDRSAQATLLLDGQADGRVRTNSTRFVSTTEVVANVTITADAVADRYDVQVALTGGKKGIGTEMFAVQAILALNAGTESRAFGVNTRGVVVGRDIRPGSCGTLAHPFVWTQASGVVDLPLPPGFCLGSAYAINESDVIVGWVNGGVGVRWLPNGQGSWNVELLGLRPDGSAIPEGMDVDEQGTILVSDGVWSPTLGFRPLTAPPGGRDCLGSARGAMGHVAGVCNVNSRRRAVLWTDPGAPPILLPDIPGGATSQANGVNRTGIVVGSVTTSPNRVSDYHAVRWVLSPAGAYTVEDLGNLGAPGASAFAINDAGHVVGRSAVSGNNYNAFLWKPGEGMLNLGSIKVFGSTANSLSEPDLWGQLTIVGYSNVGATRWVR